MNLNFLHSGKADTAERKGLNKIVVAAIVLAIIFLFGSGFFGGDKKEDKVVITEEKGEYVKEMEDKLCSTLEKIEGVGKVYVMITFESDGKKVLATDTKSKSQEKADEKSVKEKESEGDRTVVMTSQSSKGEPVVIEEKYPKPTGIVVVATGAKSESIKLKIYEAVKALYGLPAHRIKVTS